MTKLEIPKMPLVITEGEGGKYYCHPSALEEWGEQGWRKAQELQAKLEAAERDLAHALKVASVAEGMANRGKR